jgi:ribosomal protein S18 acetylase RimI-like enzyme
VKRQITIAVNNITTINLTTLLLSNEFDINNKITIKFNNIGSGMSDQIKRCTREQLRELQDVAIETYRDTFGDTNSEALMQSYLNDALSMEKLKIEFNEPNSYFYFIYHDDQIAGFLKLNELGAQTDISDDDSLEIERFYIRKAFFRRGLGNTLMKFACDLAVQSRKTYVWLGVWENNFSAIQFYQKNGFFEIGKHPFDMGGDIQTDLVLKKIL